MDGSAANAKAHMAAIDTAKVEHKLPFADGSGSYSLERKAWESATSFCARSAWVDQMKREGMSTDTQAEAEEVDRLSAMWYNMVYLGCRYDEELEERIGNPESLVKMPEKEGQVTQLQAAKSQEASFGTRGGDRGTR